MAYHVPVVDITVIKVTNSYLRKHGILYCEWNHGAQRKLAILCCPKMSVASTIYWQDKWSTAVTKSKSQAKEIKRLHSTIENLQRTDEKTRTRLNQTENLSALYERQLQLKSQQFDQERQLLQAALMNLQQQVNILETHLAQTAKPCAFCGAGILPICRMECPGSHAFCNAFLV